MHVKPAQVFLKKMYFSSFRFPTLKLLFCPVQSGSVQYSTAHNMAATHVKCNDLISITPTFYSSNVYYSS